MTASGGMRVLIVEDEADLAEVFRSFVGSLGHTADVVGTAEAALGRLQTEPPQLILLDVKLPGMSGVELMRLPLVRDAGIPVIVISGHATEDQARECLRLGALEFLSKPVPLDVLLTVLQHAEVFTSRESGGPGPERRMTRRVPARLPVRIVTERGRVVTGTSVELSGTGLRAQLDAPLRTGGAVRVSITMPDDGGVLEVIGLVVRASTDGAAVWFLDLEPVEAERLLALAGC